QRDWLFQQEARKPTAVGETLGRFWSYFRQYSHVLIVVAVVIVISTYLQVLVPSLIGQAVDCYLTPATQTGAAQASETHCWISSRAAGIPTGAAECRQCQCEPAGEPLSRARGAGLQSRGPEHRDVLRVQRGKSRREHPRRGVHERATADAGSARLRRRGPRRG